MIIHFILVEPSVPENVGAAARAIKTMGFERLRLVNPCDYLHDKAQMLAHGSVEVLRNALVFPSLTEALMDMDFVIGTTAKKRLARFDSYTCGELLDILTSKSGSVTNVALVFGRESRGLSNDELRQCNILSSIPMKTTFPSLNLGQAVMLFAYSLSPLCVTEKKQKVKSRERSQFRRLLTNVDQIMKQIGVNSNVHNRILERLCAMSDKDIHLTLSVCNRLLSPVNNE